MAPEVMSRSGHEYSADIWSAGITAIEIACGDAPYSTLPAGKVMLNILNLDPPKLPKGNWSSQFEAFIASCLQKEARNRPTVAQLMEKHKEWLSKAKDAAYLKENFLKGLPCTTQEDPSLQRLG